MVKNKIASGLLALFSAMLLVLNSGSIAYASESASVNMDYQKYTDENVTAINHNGHIFTFTVKDFSAVNSVEDKFFEITGHQRLTETDNELPNYGDSNGTPYTVHYNDVDGNLHELTLYIANDEFGINSSNSGFFYFIKHPERYNEFPETHYISNVIIFNDSIYIGGYPMSFNKEACLNSDGTLNDSIFTEEAFETLGLYRETFVSYGTLSSDVRGEYAHDWYIIFNYKEKPVKVEIAEGLENIEIAFPNYEESDYIRNFGDFKFAVKPKEGYIVENLTAEVECNGEILTTLECEYGKVSNIEKDNFSLDVIDVTHNNPVDITYLDSFCHPITGNTYSKTEEVNVVYDGWEVFRTVFAGKILEEQQLTVTLSATVTASTESSTDSATDYNTILQQPLIYKEIVDSPKMQSIYSVNERHYEYIPNTPAKDKVTVHSLGKYSENATGIIEIIAVDGHGNPVLMGKESAPTNANPNLGYQFVNVETDLPISKVKWNEHIEQMSYDTCIPSKGLYSIYFYYEPKDFEIKVDTKLKDYVTVQPYANAGEQVPIRISEDCPYDIDALFQNGSSTPLKLIEEVFVYDQHIEDETGKRIIDRYTQAFIMFDESITLTTSEESENPEEPTAIVKNDNSDNPKSPVPETEIGTGEVPKTSTLPIVLGSTVLGTGSGAGYFFLIYLKKKVKIRGVWSKEKIPGTLILGKKNEEMKYWFVPEIVADTGSKVELVSRLLDSKAYTLFPSDTKISIATATDSVTVSSEEEMLKILAEIEGPAVVGFESEKTKMKFSIELTK